MTTSCSVTLSLAKSLSTFKFSFSNSAGDVAKVCFCLGFVLALIASFFADLLVSLRRDLPMSVKDTVAEDAYGRDAEDITGELIEETYVTIDLDIGGSGGPVQEKTGGADVAELAGVRLDLEDGTNEGAWMFKEGTVSTGWMEDVEGGLTSS